MAAVRAAAHHAHLNSPRLHLDLPVILQARSSLPASVSTNVSVSTNAIGSSSSSYAGALSPPGNNRSRLDTLESELARHERIVQQLRSQIESERRVGGGSAGALALRPYTCCEPELVGAAVARMTF